MKLVICHRDRYPSFMDAVRLVVVALPATDITHEGFTANWTKNNVATGYLLDVATDSDFENIIINALAAGNVTSRIITCLDPGTDYYYRVTALDGPGTGHYSNVIEVTVALGYGLLYNWYAATDVREIAAEGWHVPTSTEFITLRDYLGGWMVAGGELKETGIVYWDTPNTGATNSVNFNAKGSGHRNYTNGLFASLGVRLELHSSDAVVIGNDIGIFLFNDNTWLSLFELTMTDEVKYGRSIRLLKDSTTLSHGETGTYTGNDGKIYRTICIGTQEWLADNLAETKYRDGTDIPIVTDNAAWAALTDGAMCAYDNDWNNV